MKKKLKCHFIIVCLICLLSACSANTNNKSVKEEQPSSIETLCTITTPKMGDSKLFFDKIVASTDGHLILFNFDGSIFKEFTNIPTNWIYPCESEHFVIAGNFNNEIRMVQFNEDYSVKSDKVLFRSSNLMIDPVILKADGKYLLTYTEIEGNVNNGDPSVENGVYMVRCYESQDLETWNKVSDIVSYKNNIEDGDMFEKDGVLYYMFEKEEYDKGASSLRVISSTDYGRTWSGERELVPSRADNEPASVFATENGYTLYYSSDVEDAGKSYNGAQIYKASFVEDFSVLDTGTLVDVEEEQGVLLYDVQQKEDGLYFLYVQDYMTDNNLVLKKVQ